MDFISILFVAVGLAMDAFSVAVTDGIILRNLKIRNAVKIALYFGIFQFGMLFIGNVMGNTFSRYIVSVDHWIAFVLLGVIGLKMIIDVIKEDEKEIDMSKNPLDDKILFLLAVATSIDALAVGVSFAAIQIDILYAASVVGIVAFLFSFAGTYIGNKCGNLFGNKSEILGGVVLIGIGVKILIEHLYF